MSNILFKEFYMTLLELNTFVRFTLGGLSTEVLDDLTLNQIIQNMLDSGVAGNDCQEKYYSIKATLIYLETKSITENAGNSVAGSIKRKVEQVGKRKVEIEWSDRTTGGISWKELLEDFLANPIDYILCDPFPETEGNRKGSVIIGVSTPKYTNSSPWRKNLNREW